VGFRFFGLCDKKKGGTEEKNSALLKSPLTPLFQRGEFLPFVKGGREGFSLGGLNSFHPETQIIPLPPTLSHKGRGSFRMKIK
jgi:hypothetical protein